MYKDPEYQKKYYAAHKEYYQRYNLEHKQIDAEKNKYHNKRFYQSHIDYQKKYSLVHKNKQLEYYKEYRQLRKEYNKLSIEDRESWKEYHNKYHKKCSEEEKESYKNVWKEYCLKNKIETKEQSMVDKILVFNHYGKKCAKCGRADFDYLTINTEKEMDIYTYELYAWIIKNNFPEHIKLLCHDCDYKQKLTRK